MPEPCRGGEDVSPFARPKIWPHRRENTAQAECGYYTGTVNASMSVSSPGGLTSQERKNTAQAECGYYTGKCHYELLFSRGSGLTGEREHGPGGVRVLHR
jgi:hypothetical protein